MHIKHRWEFQSHHCSHHPAFFWPYYADTPVNQSSNFRMKQVEDHIYKQARNKTVDEVLERLRDGILHQETGMRDAFLTYNKQASGKLSKTDFRKVNRILFHFNLF